MAEFDSDCRSSFLTKYYKFLALTRNLKIVPLSIILARLSLKYGN